MVESFTGRAKHLLHFTVDLYPKYKSHGSNDSKWDQLLGRQLGPLGMSTSPVAQEAQHLNGLVGQVVEATPQEAATLDPERKILQLAPRLRNARDGRPGEDAIRTPRDEDSNRIP